MIKLLRSLLVVTICYCFNANAQIYQSVFGQDSTTWNNFYELPDVGINVRYSVVGDTDINSISYKKLYNNWSYSIDGFLREDSTRSKLYLYYSALDSEYLVEDLNHQIGDAIFYQGEIVTIDSIYYLENRKHLRTNTFMFQWPLEYVRLEFIEGVGPTSGFFLSPFNSISFSGILLCHSRDTESTFIFSDTAYDCNYNWLGIHDISFGEKLILFPNPAQSEIVAELNEQTQLNLDYLITDMSNKILLKGKLRSGKNSIGISQLSHGSYFIRVLNEKKTIVSKLFFKL
jgi:hypothetical protein